MPIAIATTGIRNELLYRQATRKDSSCNGCHERCLWGRKWSRMLHRWDSDTIRTKKQCECRRHHKSSGSNSYSIHQLLLVGSCTDNSSGLQILKIVTCDRGEPTPGCKVPGIYPFRSLLASCGAFSGFPEDATRLTSTLSTRFPSISTTSKRYPSVSNTSPLTGTRPI